MELSEKIHYMLGAIASETNAHDKSRQHKERAMQLQQETRHKLDVVDPRLARVHSELGFARIQDGDYDAAIATIKESIAIDKQLGLYPYNWVAEVNLGLAYIMKGDLSAAEELLTGTLRRREEKFGKMDTESYR